MLKVVLAAVAALFFGLSSAAVAQQSVWIQIEARPTLTQGQERVRSYAASLAEVNGFRLSSGWYAVALGPYAPGDAQSELARLRAQGLIPGDSFVADGNQFRDQFWPIGAAAQTPRPVILQPATPVTAVETPTPSLTQTPIADETVAEARRSERDLTRPERELLQIALKWEGFYTSAIDGAFGPGTRRAMSDYQAALGYEVTGILTTRQRAELVEGYQSALASVGLEVVRSEEAGIEMQLPLARVEFEKFEPPFVHYAGDTPASKVLLISQEGDRATLNGLYDIMQTLEIVPLEGARELSRDSFILTGQNSALESFTYAQLDDGMIKGFTVSWEPKDSQTMNRIVDVMRDSLTTFGGALDDTLGEPGPDQRIDLLSGLEVRKPLKARSGFFINSGGQVLTTAEAVQSCSRITIAGDYRVEPTLVDADLGIAVLTPAETLAPMRVARFIDAIPRLQSDIAVAGYSFEGMLGAPTLTYGTLADLRGLSGEEELERLAVAVEPGDAGGPVFDTGGSVLGLLLARSDDGARQLPREVNFAVEAEAIATRLEGEGISINRGVADGAVAPEALDRQAREMTVLVSCWD